MRAATPKVWWRMKAVERKCSADVLLVSMKQNWRCGMNRTLSYGAKLFAHLDPSKGVDAYRQQDGGHGSRNPLRSV
jgi:hypothetical protein